jgi:hypothetical protein
MATPGKIWRQSLASGSLGELQGLMCVEEKCSKINKIVLLKEPAGRGEGGTPGG